jgi:hypothetical protein
MSLVDLDEVEPSVNGRRSAGKKANTQKSFGVGFIQLIGTLVRGESLPSTATLENVLSILSPSATYCRFAVVLPETDCGSASPGLVG